MPKIQICVTCEERMRRIYIRQFKKQENLKYKSRYVPIGWICSACNNIEKDYNVLQKLFLDGDK